jgi:hypothetical protein
MNAGLALLFILMINVGIAVLIFFVIKYFIRYSFELKNARSQKKSELDRMNIEDL